jgi:transcriptional regulator with XRE-family HTH domain
MDGQWALELGARIKTLRIARGLTQRVLADRVGLERTSITNIEAGRQHMPTNRLHAIGQALGCAVRVEFDPLQGDGARRGRRHRRTQEAS